MNKNSILIVAPLKQELSGFKGHLKDTKKTTYRNLSFTSGDLGDYKVLTVHSGIGVHRASRTTRAALSLFKPSCIILTGFCGGTKNDIKVGDLIISEQLISGHEQKQPHLSHPELLSYAKSLATEKIHIGITLTTQEPILKAERKQELGELMNCLSVNMEGHAVAEVAQSARIPFIEIRSVLDSAKEDVYDFNSSNAFFLKKRYLEKKMKKNTDLALNSLTPFLVGFVKNL